MKRWLFFLALLAFGLWSTAAWAQPKPKLKEISFLVNGQPVDTTRYGDVTVQLIFDIAMNTNIEPVVTFGRETPYALKLPKGEGWITDVLWQGFITVSDANPPTPDGKYTFKVYDAKSSGGGVMDTTFSGTLNSKALVICRRGLLKASADSLKFGTLKVGKDSTLAFTITNAGCSDISIVRQSITGPFTVFVDSPILGPIRSGEIFTFRVRFSPRERRTFLNKLEIEHSSAGRKDTLAVWLLGAARGPQIVLTPSAVDFGRVKAENTSLPQTVTIKNAAAVEKGLSDTLHVTNITTTNAAFLVSPQILNLKLAPDSSQKVTITFRPPVQSQAEKPYSESVNFNTNDLVQPGGMRSLPVTGIAFKDLPPPAFPAFTYTWPYGRTGFINSSVIEICLPISPAEAAQIREARWKFSTTPNDTPRAASDTTGLGGGRKLEVKGNSYCFKIPLAAKLTAYSSARFYFYLWFEGVNGVSGYNNRALRYFSELNYDVSAPAFAVAPAVQFWSGNFPGYTNADSLRVCWTNPANELSGIREVRWKFSTSPADMPADSADYGNGKGGKFLLPNGARCVTIPLKGRIVENKKSERWYCYMWLVDGIGNSGHRNAAQFKFAYDLTAPLAPAGQIVRSIPRKDWFSSKRNPLTLNFNFADGNGDAIRAFWKFKIQPNAATVRDGESALSRIAGGASFPVLFNSTALCGEDSLYFWLADSAGNANPGNFAVTGYKFDMCAPVITRLRSGEPVANKRLAFADTVRIFDHVKVVWDSAAYRFGGARANEPPRRLVRVANTKDLFVVNVPADGVTTRGIEYKVFARDSLNNPNGVGPAANSSSVCGDDDSNWQAVRVRTGVDGEFRIDKDGNPVAQPSGRDQSNYALYSVPFELDKSAPRDVLEDDLGAYDRSKWRFYEYRPEMAANGLIEYTNTAPTISPFMPGRAFFMIVADANKVIDSGAGKTVSTSRRYAIELKKGWNLFGNPFNFPVSRQNLTLVNSSIPQDSTRLSIRSFEGGWNIDDTIEPWKGYAIYVEPKRVNEKIQLLVCPFATRPRLGKNWAPAVTPAKDWTIQIAAQSGAAKDTINWLGARSAAAAEYDDFDLIEPPVIGEYVSVYVPNMNWVLHPMKYTADFRPADQEVYEWPLQVNSNSPAGEVILEFKNLANLPNGYEAYLVDAAYGLARNLKRNPSYHIATSANGVEKSLQLLVGKPEALRKRTGGIALVPDAFELSQNFPNPFAARQAQAFTMIRYALPKPATVTVEVYNMLGQKVRTLVNRQIQEADYYMATWNGRDEVGKEVSSGVYVYRLLAESQGERFASTKKLLMVK